ncbi:MAG: radical SAM family heme chaperone HemW [Nitrospirota bacterium]|mgnify:CR=1 FL=1|nr:radical SAM family heme chaperone HemW [Nitrospirota bacterium]
MTSHPLGLYIHIPFCRQRCDFCSFYLEIHRASRAEAFVRSLIHEIGLSAQQHVAAHRPIQSVYFGGGTPTVLATTQLIAILSEIRLHLTLASDCEVTVEAHPSTISEQDLERLCQAGITRMSFGAESMEDGDLAKIGRPGAVSETITAVTQARTARFANINLDVMYGLPGQSLMSWQRTLTQCLALEPTHLSCYALTVEEDTRLASNIQRQRSPAPDEGLQIEMDEAAQQMLGDAGYERYEVSNYARPEYACRHNLLYWTNGEYLGLGPSAQSYLDGTRFGNVADLAAYNTALAADRLPLEDRAKLSEEEQLRDAVIFGLRLIQGIPTSHLHQHAANYGHEAVTARLFAQELIKEDGMHSRLTARGLLQADTIAGQLY